jgi:hypothetical protein
VSQRIVRVKERQEEGGTYAKYVTRGAKVQRRWLNRKPRESTGGSARQRKSVQVIYRYASGAMGRVVVVVSGYVSARDGISGG